MADRNTYPTDVSDKEWAFVTPYLILFSLDAGQRRHDLREVFNALRYVVYWLPVADALPTNLHELDADALRQLLIAQNRELIWRQSKIDQLTHELSLHKRWRFGVKTERLSAEQAQLLEETVEADLAAMTEEFERLSARGSSGGSGLRLAWPLGGCRFAGELLPHRRRSDSA